MKSKIVTAIDQIVIICCMFGMGAGFMGLFYGGSTKNSDLSSLGGITLGISGVVMGLYMCIRVIRFQWWKKKETTGAK